MSDRGADLMVMLALLAGFFSVGFLGYVAGYDGGLAEGLRHRRLSLEERERARTQQEREAAKRAKPRRSRKPADDGPPA